MYKGKASPLTGQKKKLADFLRAPAPKCMKFLSMISVSDQDPQLKNTNLGFMLCLGIEAGLMAETGNPGTIRQSAEQLIAITNQAHDCLNKLDFHDRDFEAIKDAPRLMRVIATGMLKVAQMPQQKMAAAQLGLGLERQILTQATQEILDHVQQQLDTIRRAHTFAANHHEQDATHLRKTFEQAASLTTAIAPGIAMTATAARAKLPPTTSHASIIQGCVTIIDRATALHAGILEVAQKLDAAFNPRPRPPRKKPASPATPA